MIASYSRNFIYIKTQKTGGTSLEIVLSRWCSGQDICTTISGEDELLRRAYGSQPRNFSDPAGEAEFWKVLDTNDPREIDKLRRSGVLKSDFFNHMPASRVQALLPDLWEKAFKFAVERHPFDRAISAAFWFSKREGENFRLEKAIDSAIANPTFPNHPLYMENGRLLVDRVFDYDTMWTQIEQLRQELGAPRTEDLPRAKGNYRKDRRLASEVLTPDQKRRIVAVTEPEFELMGWSPA